MKKILEITPQSCAEVYDYLGQVTYETSLLRDSPEDIALVVFTGGHDVWPELYGEKALNITHYSKDRDRYESQFFDLALKNKIPMVGICRGSQFLCVKAGGKLVQDITGHLGNHRLLTNDGRLLVCNSSHHQMQLPPESAIPLAWCDVPRSRWYLNGDGDKIKVDREHEIVYYPNINAIGIQGHPEWLYETHEFVKYSQEVVNKYLFK